MYPACADKRLHRPAEWAHYHPYVHHGFNGTVWTHPDLVPQHDVKHAGAASLDGEISGEVHPPAEAAAPAEAV